MTPLLSHPELGEDTLTARPYQVEALNNVRAAMARGVRAVMVCHPTGTGKTVLVAKMTRMAAQKGDRTLVLAHREELITQMANKLDQVGIIAGIEKARSLAREHFIPQAVVASVQTLNPKRLATWPRDFFQLVVIDECHHVPAVSYRRILNHFHRANIVGVTATPDRADGESLMQVFGEVAHEMNIWQAMEAPHPGPYLCQLLYAQRDVQIDLRDLRRGKGDFSDADLEARICPHIDTLANAIRQEAGDRPTIVFTPGVDSATAMASALRSLGLAADWISDKDPDRKAKVARYQAKESQFLVNCMILTEGFDAPHTAAVALCRPTKSRALFSQMIGRGTRLGKPDCKIIDFNYLTAQHDPVRPEDLFLKDDGSAEVRKMVEETLKSGESLNILDVIEQSTAKVKAIEAERRRREIEVRAREREIKYRRSATFNPLNPDGKPTNRGKILISQLAPEKPTPKQIAYLKRCGRSDAEGYTRQHAGRLIGIFEAKRKAAEAAAASGAGGDQGTLFQREGA